MNRNRIWTRTAYATALAAAFLPVLTGAAGPVGGEFRVNLSITGSQINPAVGMDADGDFVVTWSGPGQTDSNGVHAQRYSVGGVALGAEFRVNTYTTGAQSNSVIAVEADGDFVVAWTSDLQDGLGLGVYAQRYAADGTVRGGEFRVNTYTTLNQGNPVIGVDADGDFVIAWSSDQQDLSGYGIYHQRYAADGSTRGSEFRVNTYVTGAQGSPVIGMEADGDFVVVWSGAGQTDTVGIYAQRYAANGSVRGLEFRVNSFTTNGQNLPAISVDAAGNFVVAWQGLPPSEQGLGISAQRYTADGATLGSEFAVNSYITSNQSNASVSMDADGDFVVAWVSGGQDGSSYGIYAQRYAADGSTQGGEFRVNTYTTGFQTEATIAMDADGDFVVAWTSDGQDGSGLGTYAQRYGGDQPVDVSLEQYDSADPAAVGSGLSYTLIAANLAQPVMQTGIAVIDAALNTSSGLRIVDVLPANSSNISTFGDGWSCALPEGRAICDYALALAPGEEAAPLVIEVLPPESPGFSVRNVARVTAAQTDPDISNNRSVERTRLECPESLIEFSAPAFSVSEGGVDATVTVTRSSSCGPASVQYDTAASSALTGADFTDVTGILAWSDGEGIDKSFTVPIGNDRLDEVNERFVVSLGSVNGARLGLQKTARVVINDDDASPRVNFTARSQSVNEAAGLATVSVALTEISGREVEVPFTLGGTATSNADYFAGNRVFIIPAGALSATKYLEVADDDDAESDETAVLTLGTPLGATVGTVNPHTLTITDDDAAPVPPTVSFTAAASSGDEATTRSAQISLSAASSQTVTVPFTISGSATQGGDYALSRSSPITFNPGVTVIGIQTVPVDDAIDEANETVILTLAAPTGASLGATTVHTRTIVDNDP